MYDWQVSEEPDGGLTAQLCGTHVRVSPAADEGAGDAGGWCWEVRFADGQTQTGTSADADAALQKGKEVAERFLP